MANEELLKKMSEAARKAAGPAEASPAVQPEVAPEPSVEASPKTDVWGIAKERIAAFSQKVSEGLPNKASHIVGSVGEYPQDARVFEIVEGLFSASEEQLSDPEFMRGVAQKLVGVVNEAGYITPTGREANKYLNRIIADNSQLGYLRDEIKLPAVIQGGSGEVEQQNNKSKDVEPEAVDDMLDPEMAAQVRALYDEPLEDKLKGTPLAYDLKELQYRLRVDPGVLFSDEHMTDRIAQKMVITGHKENLDPKIVREAVGRVRELEAWAAHKNEQLSSRGVVRWSDVKEEAGADVARDDRESFYFRDITRDEVDRYFKRGTEGEADWYFNFIDQIYSLGREESRPGLTHEQRFQEFKDYMVWKYGGEYHLAVQLYQKHWDSRGQFEYAVKGLMYNPGDVKDRLKAMSLLTGADLDHLYKNFDHSNEAYNLYEHVMFETMAEKRRVYSESISYLKEEVDWKGKRLKREDLLKELKKQQKLEGFDPEKGVRTESGLTLEDQKLMLEIQAKMDLAAEGVGLWDSDVQSYTELHITLSKLQKRREELLKKKADGNPLTESEVGQLEEVDRLYEIYAHRDQMLNENFTQELLQTRGLSPVDIEVRKRLVGYLKSQNGGKEPPEYEVRMALWAARTAMIGSGRMAMIGAMMAVPPGVEYGTGSGKHVMRAPAFEDLQRIFNPETFATRFGIGGDMGKTARSILRQNLLKTKGLSEKDPSIFEKFFSKFKLTKSHEWSDAIHHEHDNQRKAALESMEFAEDATGISFSELLGPSFMATGGFYDGTAWRLDKGIFDELRGKVLAMKKLPETAKLLDNQALSIQLLTAGNAEERRPILDRMLRRNPSKFLELLEQDTEKILAKNGVSNDEWKKFKEALSLAELKMAHDKDWQYARVDLADQGDFDKLLAPFLRNLNIGDERMGQMRQILIDMQAEVYRSHPTEASGAKFRNKMDAVAHLKMPLTMSLTDFDWKESNFYQLGTVAMHRRIRDVGAQMRARDAILEFVSNQDMLLSPNDYVDSLKKIKEIREAIIDYSGPDAAEGTAKEIARMFLEMNRHRSLWTIGAVPGLTWIMKYMAEADVGAIANSPIGKAWEAAAKFISPGVNLFRFTKDKPHVKVKDLPHTIGEAISYSVKFTGTHANAWDEAKMEEIITTMQDMGMFINHPEYAQQLRKEFHTTLADRWFAMGRKYWWVVIAATIGIAATQAVEEEGKSGGGGGGHH